MSHALFEGGIEGAVTSVAAVVSQLLNGEGAVGINSFTIETDEMIDAKIIDIDIVINSLTGEILTEIEKRPRRSNAYKLNPNRIAANTTRLCHTSLCSRSA